MIMSDDKKKRATLIISRLKDGKESLPEEAPMSDDGAELENDSQMGLDSAVDELMSAIEAKDAMAVKEALLSIIELADEQD